VGKIKTEQKQQYARKPKFACTISKPCINYIITLRIHAISLVDSHDLLEDRRTEYAWLVFIMSKIFENSTEFIQIEWIHAITSIIYKHQYKYLRLMCKNHSQELATRQISIHSDVIDFKFNPVLIRKQILFESFDPVDVTFSSWFLHFVQQRQCFMLFNHHSRSEQNNGLFITRFYFFETIFFSLLIDLFTYLLPSSAF
jgi:hypothetical protein